MMTFHFGPKPTLLVFAALALTSILLGAAASPGQAARAHYVVHASSDTQAPEGDEPKVVISVTAAVAGRRYFLSLKRTSPYRQPASGRECSDSAGTAIGLRASGAGAVEFRPLPGTPYALGGSKLCKGLYNGEILEQRAGRGARVVRRFTLTAPAFALATRPTR